MPWVYEIPNPCQNVKHKLVMPGVNSAAVGSIWECPDCRWHFKIALLAGGREWERIDWDDRMIRS